MPGNDKQSCRIRYSGVQDVRKGDERGEEQPAAGSQVKE